jgi:aspartate aminotransferase
MSTVTSTLTSPPAPKAARGRFAGLAGSRILAIADEVRALQAAGRQVCNLSIGDFDPREFPIPEALLTRIEGALRRGETNYPPSAGVASLREQVSALYAREFGLAMPPASIVITGGSRPGLFAAYQLTVEPGDKVVFPVPSWNNDHYCELSGATQVPVECGSDTAFLPTAAMLAPHLRGARLLSLNSPLNPSGTSFDAETLAAICDAVLEENARRSPEEGPLYLLYDQVYWMLTFGGLAHVVPQVLRPEIAPYTILIDGISKAFAATGLRVGWICAPPQLAGQLGAFLGHVGAWAPRPVQVATAEMLADTEAVAEARRTMQLGLERRLRRLHAGMLALQQAGVPVETVAPSGGMYLSVRFGSGSAGAAGNNGAGAAEATESVRRHLLQEAGLAVVPFEAFGSHGEAGWFRLSVGSVSERAIEELLGRLRGALEALPRS